ncbi:MAG TPA: pentapeptide repeat-containing protein [Methanothrix sp.]|nr:pentapeptide repeat-containing protein [Methanothrix sp.]HRW82534.1 pentapeptide repeat-containing protein [Methanothrix sp.]
MKKSKKSNPKLKATKPKGVFEKQFNVDLKQLFKSISKGIGHAAFGRWEEISNDAVETLSAVGLETQPEELAFLLIQRSLIKALFDLVGESASQQLADAETDYDALVDQLDISISTGEVRIDKRFFDRPGELPLIKKIQPLLQRLLEGIGVTEPAAKAIVERLPSYFAYALNQEWQKNSKTYRPIVDVLDTPFAKASDREWAWAAYSALLRRKVNEGIFDEPFSLSQIYVPLNAFYYEEKAAEELEEGMTGAGRKRQRVVVSLQKELEQWLANSSPHDAIRVISGGPGSGKSSFIRIFAAKLSHNPKLKVLYVPLHLIDATKDLVEEIGRFVRDEGVLIQNPLDPNSPEANLLIIFDGLDELASQGKAAAETARSFVREVERTVETRNLQSVKLRVLISGRELVVQENEAEFRRTRQILNLLPYFIPRTPRHDFLFRTPEYVRHFVRDVEEYHDPEKLLMVDLRQQWWKNYGALIGEGYDRMPNDLSREDLEEITAQPLLNYLVALSFSRKVVDFEKDVNLNSIYADLVAEVHERGYEHRAYPSIRHMTFENFSRVLEEIGLAAWHGDGRTTTIREIEEHCRSSGVGSLLDSFEEGAKEGVTRLLAAFFFRRYGQRVGGDPTFVFTHKSFGEYLTARRVVRAVERVNRELNARAYDTDSGWDEQEALKHWAQICGPSAVTPYLHFFILNEIKLRPAEELAQWQEWLSTLFNYMLQNGMPMEQIQIRSFKKSLYQSRNAEEALLVALNACALVTRQVSPIEQTDPTVFGTWFRRVQGQRTGAESVLAARCLSLLHLAGTRLDIGDFYNADLRYANLLNVNARFVCFGDADLEGADLRGAHLIGANLEGANLEGANLGGANLQRANLEGANLGRANLEKVSLRRADLEGAHLEGANLKEADLQRADLQRAHLQRANLQRANFWGANLEGANLEGANLKGTILEGSRR